MTAAVLLLVALCCATPSVAQSPVGRLITPKGPVCTGVLVSDYAVLTAAHCVVTRSGTSYFSADLIHFSLPFDDDSGPGAYAKGAELHVNPEYRLPVSLKPEVLAEDWAILILDKPLGREVTPAPIIPASSLQENGITALSITAFGRARTSRPTVLRGGCRVLTRGSRTLTHNCMVERGSSGSVLLSERNGRLYAIAVNVAVHRREQGPYTTAALLSEAARRLANRMPPKTDAGTGSILSGEKGPWSR